MVFEGFMCMNDIDLRPVTAADVIGAGGALLALNNAHVDGGWLEPEKLRHLVAEAFLARRIGESDAFLLALDQDADYDSANFQWFRARYERFVYIDRIVVAATARGRGLARRLYLDLFDHALRAGHERATCEVNIRPPNPISHAFHAALGFAEVGQSGIGESGRIVRYYCRDLIAPTAA
jgi:predicted GNAT superfamily acetyltransferase